MKTKQCSRGMLHLDSLGSRLAVRDVTVDALSRMRKMSETNKSVALGVPDSRTATKKYHSTNQQSCIIGAWSVCVFVCSSQQQLKEKK